MLTKQGTPLTPSSPSSTPTTIATTTTNLADPTPATTMPKSNNIQTNNNGTTSSTKPKRNSIVGGICFGSSSSNKNKNIKRRDIRNKSLFRKGGNVGKPLSSSSSTGHRIVIGGGPGTSSSMGGNKNNGRKKINKPIRKVLRIQPGLSMPSLTASISEKESLNIIGTKDNIDNSSLSIITSNINVNSNATQTTTTIINTQEQEQEQPKVIPYQYYGMLDPKWNIPIPEKDSKTLKDYCSKYKYPKSKKKKKKKKGTNDTTADDDDDDNDNEKDVEHDEGKNKDDRSSKSGTRDKNNNKNDIDATANSNNNKHTTTTNNNNNKNNDIPIEHDSVEDANGGPLVEIIDGEIVIRASTTVVGTHQTIEEVDAELLRSSKIVDEDEGIFGTGILGSNNGGSGGNKNLRGKVGATYASFVTGQRLINSTTGSTRWTAVDTRDFYTGLRTYGTDFASMASEMFSGRIKKNDEKDDKDKEDEDEDNDKDKEEEEKEKEDNDKEEEVVGADDIVNDIENNNRKNDNHEDKRNDKVTSMANVDSSDDIDTSNENVSVLRPPTTTSREEVVGADDIVNDIGKNNCKKDKDEDKCNDKVTSMTIVNGGNDIDISNENVSLLPSTTTSSNIDNNENKTSINNENNKTNETTQLPESITSAGPPSLPSSSLPPIIDIEREESEQPEVEEESEEPQRIRTQRTRRQLKCKYMIELRAHPELVDMALDPRARIPLFGDRGYIVGDNDGISGANNDNDANNSSLVVLESSAVATPVVEGMTGGVEGKDSTTTTNPETTRTTITGTDIASMEIVDNSNSNRIDGDSKTSNTMISDPGANNADTTTPNTSTGKGSDVSIAITTTTTKKNNVNPLLSLVGKRSRMGGSSGLKKRPKFRAKRGGGGGGRGGNAKNNTRSLQTKKT